MPATAGPTRIGLGALARWRGAAMHFALPILAAWLLTHAINDRIHPRAPKPPTDLTGEQFGAVRMEVKLPGTCAGIPEPLLVCGRPGSASLVYIRLMSGNRARVGVEFWGLRADEGDPFPLSAQDAVLAVTCYLPALFPEEGDPYWGNLAPALQRLRRTQYFIAVDGVVRLKGTLAYPQPLHSPIYLGVNPIGGSVVSNRFTGAVVSSQQR